MGRSTDKEMGLSEQRKYRSWTAQQKIEIVLAGMRDRTEFLLANVANRSSRRAGHVARVEPGCVRARA